MRNRDIVELFERVPCLTPVRIVEYSVVSGDWAQLGTAAEQVRRAVFVAEQGVPADMELDELDPMVMHAVARRADGTCIGTARLIPEAAGTARVGRMAVLADWRRQGVGAALLWHLFEQAAKNDVQRLVLSAQLTAMPFYRRYGFVEEGSEYLDAGIRHMTMRRALTSR
jgi:predicted GNAT family N-acyltransferase